MRNRATLASDIKMAFDKQAAKPADSDANQCRLELSQDIANAIDIYIANAEVQTFTGTIQVTTNGSAVTQVGVNTNIVTSKIY